MRTLIFLLIAIIWLFAVGFGIFTLVSTLYAVFHWNDVQMWIYGCVVVYFPILVIAMYQGLKN